MFTTRKMTYIWVILSWCAFIASAYGAEDALALKREILSHEINVPNVAIKEMGGSDDVMLEGKVTSQLVSEQIQKKALEFFPKIFNLLNVSEVKVFTDVSLLVFSSIPKNLNSGSHLMKALHNGFESEGQFELIIFDTSTRQSLFNEVTSKFNARSVNLEPKKELSSANRFSFEHDQGTLEVVAQYLDQGFFDIRLTFEDASLNLKYQKSAFCPRGQNLMMAYRHKESGMYHLFFIQMELESGA